MSYRRGLSICQKQVRQRYTERSCDVFEIPERRVALRQLDPGQVDPVDVGAVCEFFLRPPLGVPQLANALGQRLGGRRRRRGTATFRHAEMLPGVTNWLNKL